MLNFCVHNVLSSCNIGEGGIALAEAVHGSAPDIAGKVSQIILFLPSSFLVYMFINLNLHACIFK